ncbi:lecithin retinol acyltransferase family protein [bacterium]|nr:lecithin retinol acyltransferase family protein [bacterium]
MRSNNNGMWWGNEPFTPGDVLVVKRLGYSHKAIYIGNWEVVHYTKWGAVDRVHIESFALGAQIHVEPFRKPVSRDEVVERAQSLVGQGNYNPVTSNCEHLVYLCTEGRARSPLSQAGVVLALLGLALLPVFFGRRR